MLILLWRGAMIYAPPPEPPPDVVHVIPAPLEGNPGAGMLDVVAPLHTEDAGTLDVRGAMMGQTLALLDVVAEMEDR